MGTIETDLVLSTPLHRGRFEGHRAHLGARPPRSPLVLQHTTKDKVYVYILNL